MKKIIRHFTKWLCSITNNSDNHRHFFIIGNAKNGCGAQYSFLYKVEMFCRAIRQFVALIIYPELRSEINRHKDQTDYLIKQRDTYIKDIKSRDKAIARLQRERKVLRQKIREQNN